MLTHPLRIFLRTYSNKTPPSPLKPHGTAFAFIPLKQHHEMDTSTYPFLLNGHHRLPAGDRYPRRYQERDPPH